MIADIKNPVLRKLAVIGGMILVGPFIFFEYLAGTRWEPDGFWAAVRFAWRGGR